ncbi:copine-8-like [Ornithodoros turicata]|uniref:copine-8-like n=1 Tax=Ornithodoros turicata TaxID=34597 RepID=UPI003138A0C3
MERDQSMPEGSHDVDDSSGIVLDLAVTCGGLKETPARPRKDIVIVFLVRAAGTAEFCEESRSNGSSGGGTSPGAHFRTVYRFGETQILRFEVYCQYKGARGPEFLGRAECTPLDVVVCLSSQFRMKLFNEDENKQVGTLTIVPTATNLPTGYSVLEFSGTSVPLKEVFKTADPMLELWKVEKGGRATLMYTTEVVNNNANPTWKPLVVNKEKLGGNNPNEAVEIRVLDVSFSGERKVLGKFWTSVRQLASGAEGGLTFAVQETVKEKEESDKEPMLVQLLRYRDFPWFFLDYMNGDFQFNFAVIVDVSSSNGTMHTLRGKPNRYNLYENAIRAFSDVIQQYDEQQMIPLVGFGAKVPPNFMNESLIFLNGADSVRCRGVKGLLEAYRTKVPQLEPAEPSELSPALNYAAKLARDASDPLKYYVVLVFTDGKLDYTLSTLDTLVGASSAPMSVIFVGIGDNELPFFKEIEAKKLRQRTQSRTTAERDFVSTVAMKDYMSSKRLHDLPKDALCDVPDHVMQFLALNDIKPKEKKPPVGDTAVPVRPPSRSGKILRNKKSCLSA